MGSQGSMAVDIDLEDFDFAEIDIKKRKQGDWLIEIDHPTGKSVRHTRLILPDSVVKTLVAAYALENPHHISRGVSDGSGDT